jgi:hypothetical protein
VFDKLHMEDPIVVPPCPQCRDIHVSRQVTPAALYFKGEGWDASDRRVKTRIPDPYECVDKRGNPVTAKGEPL